MSIAAIIQTTGTLEHGDSGIYVTELQNALVAAGYRVSNDGQFGPRTEQVVRQFQTQHSLAADGRVGPATARVLDQPCDTLVAKATPLISKVTRWPHDDTASLRAFYGEPWNNSSLLVRVPVPFTMTYGDTPVRSIQIHSKIAEALNTVLHRIAAASQGNPAVLRRIGRFSGSYNYRPVRGSSRLSCHAFGAALDFDAGSLPLGKTGITADDMPREIVDAFKDVGATWGNDYTGRKDPMHFQFADE